MAQKRIGRYGITREIASGAQGAVYQAFDISSNRTVAVKVLHSTLLTEPQYLERFHREATVMASISHPNVVVIYDVGSEGDTHFLAMEYLPQSLGEYVIFHIIVSTLDGFVVGRNEGICIDQIAVDPPGTLGTPHPPFCDGTFGICFASLVTMNIRLPKLLDPTLLR